MTGNIPAVVAGLLANPKVAANLITTYGKLTQASKPMIASILKKLKMGSKLSPAQSKVMTKILKEADSKIAAPIAATKVDDVLENQL